MNAHSRGIKGSTVSVQTAWRNFELTAKHIKVCKYTTDNALPDHVYSHGGMIGWLRKQFPQSMTYHVEAVTGIPASTVHGWVVREYRPSLQHFMRMLCVFGPAFAAASLSVRVDWIREAERQRRIVETEAEIARLEAERDSLTME